MRNTPIASAVIALLPILAGCTTDGARKDNPDPSRARLQLDRTVGGSRDGAPPREPRSGPDRAAVIDGSVVTWEALRAPMIEAAGAVVLEEVALDRALRRALDRAGLRVTDAMIETEERALLDELANIADGANRAELLDGVKRARGLGPERFARLLERNAGLRALILDAAEPEAGELRLARDIAFGQTYRVRLFVADSDDEAARVRAAVSLAEQQARRWIFADACARASTHPTAARGGLIETLSASDPAYPDVLRDAVRGLDPGQVSPVLVTSAGFALVMVESITPARSPSAAETSRVEQRVRSRKQRVEMEQLARRLLNGTSVSPVDPGLAGAWRDRRR